MIQHVVGSNVFRLTAHCQWNLAFKTG